MSERPMDRILVEGLRFDCIIGINEWERLAKQPVEIDLTLYGDLIRAAESDDVADTVNYRTISRDVRDLVEGSSFGLVEKLAHEIARVCLVDERVKRVDVRLRKPGALRLGRSVGIDISRTREDL